ncbi:MAG: AAA family ATPase, partial [Alphaproteobacteria bacterium]|nr:AAA family ATPase [Alphaproteobacteria bacterium]
GTILKPTKKNIKKRMRFDDEENERDIKKLRAVVERHKITDIYQPGYDKTIDSIMSLFKIKPYYRPVLSLFINYHKNNLLAKGLGFISETRWEMKVDPKSLTTIATVCGIKPSVVEKSLNESSPLLTSGILCIDDDGHIGLDSKIQKVCHRDIKSPVALKNMLLNKPCVANVDLDFSYASKEYSHIQNLLKSAVRKKIPGINILIYGKPGIGKTEMAKKMVVENACDLYSDITTMKACPDKTNRVNFLFQAQTILSKDDDSVLLMDEAEDIFMYDSISRSSISKLYLNKVLETNKKPVIWILNSIENINKAYIRRFTYCCKMPQPIENNKKRIWQNICNKYKYTLAETEINDFIKKYNVVPGIIDMAIKSASLTHNKGAIEQTMDSFIFAMTGERPNKKITNADNVDFDTTLLNTDTDMKLLADRLTQNKAKSFSLCLYGASGTGKTAYVQYLADKLNMKVIKKRASDLNNKYVGETEKNIARAFAEARDTNSILVFDEADSFLMDRTYATHDWETASVNEMLTQMENAQIPFVCTTNLMNSLDAAALRRFTFKVKYDYMKLEQVKIAYKDFFNLEPDNQTISSLLYLAPGDFVVVKNKAKILGITDINTITDMLKNEMKVKKDAVKHGQIGFYRDCE